MFIFPLLKWRRSHLHIGQSANRPGACVFSCSCRGIPLKEISHIAYGLDVVLVFVVVREEAFHQFRDEAQQSNSGRAGLDSMTSYSASQTSA